METAPRNCRFLSLVVVKFVLKNANLKGQRNGLFGHFHEFSNQVSRGPKSGIFLFKSRFGGFKLSGSVAGRGDCNPAISTMTWWEFQPPPQPPPCRHRPSASSPPPPPPRVSAPGLYPSPGESITTTIRPEYYYVKLGGGYEKIRYYQEMYSP